METKPTDNLLFENKNDKQVFFAQIRGILAQMNDHEKFCNITLDCGHESIRQVNLVLKKSVFDALKEVYSIGDKVMCRYYLTSKFKNGRWYTCANLLEMHKSN